MRILVIEDDRDIREMLAVALEGEGYSVVVSPREPNGPFPEADVIISDLVTLTAYNFEVAERWVKGLSARAPTIVITGHSEALRDAARLGAFRVLAKPFDIADLLAAVSDASPPNGGSTYRPLDVPPTAR